MNRGVMNPHRTESPTTARPRTHRAAILVAAIAVTSLVAACGSGTPTSTATATSTTTAQAGFISPDRCAQNRSAGTITYLSGFQWSATVGTIDVAAAAANGWYRDLCLTVDPHPGTGDPSIGTKTVASGRTTIAEVGGASDALTAVAGGVPLDAIATYGNVPAITLITMASVTDLHQLEGRTLGYKGAMPPQITAMLEHLRVDTSKIREVGVGYDPTILPRGQVQALTGYKSSEVPTLRSAGYKVTAWNPDAYGITGTFNTLVANRGFAAAHPTAVQDFLRATFHAYDWCHANTAACLADEAKLSQVGYNTASERTRWTTESGLVDAHLLAGAGVGAETTAQFEPELSLLVAYKLIPAAPDLATLVTPQFVNAIETGGRVVWPAP